MIECFFLFWWLLLLTNERKESGMMADVLLLGWFEEGWFYINLEGEFYQLQ